MAGSDSEVGRGGSCAPWWRPRTLREVGGRVERAARPHAVPPCFRQGAGEGSASCERVQRAGAAQMHSGLVALTDRRGRLALSRWVEPSPATHTSASAKSAAGPSSASRATTGAVIAHRPVLGRWRGRRRGSCRPSCLAAAAGTAESRPCTARRRRAWRAWRALIPTSLLCRRLALSLLPFFSHNRVKRGVSCPPCPPRDHFRRPRRSPGVFPAGMSPRRCPPHARYARLMPASCPPDPGA